jgi:Flp pilus assembly protein TadD
MHVFPVLIGAALLSGCGVLSTPATLSTPDAMVKQEGGPDVPDIQTVMQKSLDKALAEKNYKKAGDYYQQLMLQAPSNTTYVLGFAEMRRRTGEYDIARKAYEALLEQDAENLDALEGLGLTLLALDESQEAATHLEKVMQRDDKRWKTANAIGIAFTLNKKPTEAIAYFKHALEVSPDNPSVLNNIGLALAVDKRYPEAVQALALAKKHLPNDRAQDAKRMDMNLALVHGASGDLEAAEAIAKRYYSGPELYNNLGFYAKIAKDEQLARSYLNMALSKSEHYYDKAWENLKGLEHP